MKRFLVIKFSGNELYVYIAEAENAEYALTLFFGTSKCIGKFAVERAYGDGGVAIELQDEVYDVDLILKPLRWFVENQQIMQNNV